MPPQAASPDPELDILILATEDKRRMYDHITNTYDQLRIKAVALIAGEIALVAFIFATSRLQVPAEYYGQVFFFAAVLFLAASFGVLFWTISALEWMVPTDLMSSKELLDKFATPKAYLRYAYDEYLTCIQHCLPRVDVRAKRFNWALNLLAASAIVLLVIKFGGA